ncbi:MAG: hypothetical protein ACI865_002084 [Flavobacteriaceae bacterium]|jgi:hypothetical protein
MIMLANKDGLSKNGKAFVVAGDVELSNFIFDFNRVVKAHDWMGNPTLNINLLEL